MTLEFEEALSALVRAAGGETLLEPSPTEREARKELDKTITAMCRAAVAEAKAKWRAER